MIVKLFSNGLVANINYYAAVQAENIQLPNFRGRRRRNASASGRPLSSRSCSINKKYIRTIVCKKIENAKKLMLLLFCLFLRVEKLFSHRQFFTILYFVDQVCQWAKLFGPT